MTSVYYEDPDLYGLRRSSRATLPVKKLVDSDDDSDDYNKPSKKKKTKAKREPNFDSTASESDNESTESEEDESDGYYASKKARQKEKQKQRAARKSAAEDDDFVRFSSRNGKPLPNYDENNYEFSDESDVFEDELATARRKAVVVPEYAIDGVFNHRTEGDDVRYLIKWTGYSHLHNTWETMGYLRQFKGFKKVENYKKLVDAQEGTEDSEARAIQRERTEDQLELYKKVDRVISHRNARANADVDHDHVEYLVKWRGLFYEDATWEDHDTLRGIDPGAIDGYLERTSNPRLPHKSVHYAAAARPAFQRLTAPPDYIESCGTLKDFQLTGLNWLAYLWSRNENGILADEMGLGKTVQSCAFLSYLYHDVQQYGPFLIVVPLSTLPAWQMQLALWSPDLNVIAYIGNGKSRKTIRDYEFYSDRRKVKFNVLLTTYEFVLKDRSELSAIKWQYLLIDEAHRLKNAESNLYECLMSFSTANRMLITGTPLQNNVRELLALMHFLHPERFGLGEHDFDLDDGNENEGQIRELHTKLESLMLRRLKKDVIKELPTKSELILRVEMSTMQNYWYKNILAKNYAALSAGESQVSLLNVAMELKKASNHPFLFDGAEPAADTRDEVLRGLVRNSGKMVLLDKLLDRLKRENHRVLVFSQMVRMLDILSDYCSLRGYIHQRLDGTVPSETRRKAIEHFNTEKSPDFLFLLSTRAGGLGINLETADTVILFDSDWNPHNDLQAMARAHRIGQKNHVTVYRFVTKDTVEEDILERARKKMVLEYAIVNQMDTSGGKYLTRGSEDDPAAPDADNLAHASQTELSAILKFGAANVFKSNGSARLDEEMDLDEILTKAEAYETTTGTETGASSGGAEFLQQFAVQDVKAEWDDIIPLAVREQVAEEHRREEETAANEAAIALYARRAAAQVPAGAYVGADAAPAKATPKKVIVKTTEQRALTLKERDIRVLIRGIQRFGDIRHRYDDIVRDAGLENKNRAIVIQTADEIMETCQNAISEQPTSENKPKTVLTTYKNVAGINAETVIQRADQLLHLNNCLKKLDNPLTFRLPFKAKNVINWNCEWGPEQDARLLVGIWRYGHGCWEKITEDESLGLKNYVFFNKEEKKIPQSIHLVRRADYLISTLREEITGGPLAHNGKSHTASAHNGKAPAHKDLTRIKKEGTPLAHPRSRKEGTPLVKIKRESGSREPSLTREKVPAKRSESKAPVSVSKKTDKVPSSDKKEPTSSNGKDMHNLESEGESDEDPTFDAKEMLRPVKRELKKLKTETNTLEREEKVAHLKKCLTAIGQRIDEVVGSVDEAERDKRKTQLWKWTTHFFPSEVTWQQIEGIYMKLKQASNPPVPAESKKRESNDDSIGDGSANKKIKM